MNKDILDSLDEKTKSLIHLAKEKYTCIEEIESVLYAIKKNGGNRIHTMRVLIYGLGFKSNEADDIILKSKTWSGTNEDVYWLREIFLKGRED